MPVVTLRPRARVDIAEIWQYIVEDSEAQADAFIDRFDSQFHLLSLQPRLGRRRDELVTGLHSFPFEQYVIFYTAVKNGIELVRVLHSARDVATQFRRRAT